MIKICNGFEVGDLVWFESEYLRGFKEKKYAVIQFITYAKRKGYKDILHMVIGIQKKRLLQPTALRN